MSLTYSKAIDDITDNAVILDICGKIAETLLVPYSRVTDAYGGFKGSPSPTLPKKAAAAATTTTTKAATNTTNTTATKTRVLATANTTNATAKPSSYKIDLFVQPDPFADTVDNAATVTTLKGTAVAAAVEGVTKTKYGAATVAASSVKEAAVKWTKTPAATGGDKSIAVTATTDVAAYVYCAVAKSAAKRLRMLNATSNATNATTTAPATPKAAAVEEVVNLQSASLATKYTIQRKETTATSLSVSMSFTGLDEGKTYEWLCEATSLNPSNPQFRTAMSKGSATTKAAPVVPAGDSALWSSLFAAVLMIAAVFFY